MNPPRVLNFRSRIPRLTHADERGMAALIDSLIAIAVFGLLAAGVIRVSALELERAEMNAVAVELSGWLQSIQRAAMRLSADQKGLSETNDLDAGCVVTFTSPQGGEDVGAGQVIARVEPKQPGLAPTLCNHNPEFLIPGSRHEGNPSSSTRRLTLSLTGAADGKITFTPRGTVTNINTVDLIIGHKGDSHAARCVRVHGITGLIEVGRDNSSPTSGCVDASFDSLI